MISFLTCPTVVGWNKELDGNQQLLASCKVLNVKPVHVNAAPCLYYIKGFLAGAWNLDQIIATKLKEKNQGPPTWVERYYEARYGRISSRVKPTSFTHLCLPDNESEARIIEKLSKGSLSRVMTIQAINTQIYNTIKAICPSNKIDEK